MAEPKESFETVSGCRVHMLRGGRGPTLLFLHGARGAGTWLPFFRTLSDSYDVIVPEHPGFGRSESPDWLDTVGDLAFFYLDFMERLGLSDVHLMGTSMGGWIAAELATRNTSRLRTLTLVAPAGIHVPGVPRGDMFLWSPEQAARNLVYDQALAERMLAQTPSEEEQDRQLKNQLMVAKLAWQPRLHNPHLAKWLHRIDKPTMVVWGDSDKLLPPAYAKAWRELIPGSRLELVPQCGHMPHNEHTDTVLRLLKEHAR